MNSFKKFLAYALVIVAVASIGNAALTKLNWSQVDPTTTPTTAAGYGITDAVSSSQLTTHEQDNSTHGASALASETFVTNSINTHSVDQSTHGSTVVASQTYVDVDHGNDNSIHGASVLASQTYVDVDHGNDNSTHGCTVIASQTYADTAAQVSREAGTLSEATNTITLSTLQITTDEKQYAILLNGLTQVYTSYTTFSATDGVILGGIASSGTSWEVIQFD